MDVCGWQARGIQSRLRGAAKASWVGSIPPTLLDLGRQPGLESPLVLAPDNRTVMSRVIRAYRQARCVGVAVELGIADRLAEEPRTVAELAVDVGAHAPVPEHQRRLGLVHRSHDGVGVLRRHHSEPAVTYMYRGPSVLDNAGAE